MRRVRIGIIGAGAMTEWAILPVLSGPDAVAPPDTGAWWTRRPSAHTSIQYQAPAWPEVVAVADADTARAERITHTARVRAVYSDWRRMLRETPLDALICVAPPEMTSEVVLAASPTVNWVWVYGPPAASVVATVRLGQRLAGRATQLWCARPLRYAAAHRAARQLLERDEIGAVSALTLRWGTAFYAPPKRAGGAGAAMDDASHLSSSYAALDLLLSLGSFSGGSSAVPLKVMASATTGATSLYFSCANGTGATALFAGAESWNAPLPRLEICGTEGRAIICEAGRRLWLHKPHEATRFMEPPGLTTHISTANTTGVAEDLKAFLGTCAEGLEGNDMAGDGVGEDSSDAMLTGAMRALQLLEAAGASLTSERLIEIESLRAVQQKAEGADNGVAKGAAAATAFTLPLQL